MSSTHKEGKETKDKDKDQKEGDSGPRTIAYARSRPATSKWRHFIDRRYRPRVK